MEKEVWDDEYCGFVSLQISLALLGAQSISRAAEIACIDLETAMELKAAFIGVVCFQKAIEEAEKKKGGA